MMGYGLIAIALVLTQAPDTESIPNLIKMPQAHRTLVNPQCSHCRDEARRRAKQLRTDDPVLCWIRGKYDGGAIPIRFFLNPYRVISDTYGVFVYDPDAGFTRGFAPSLDFTFYGWHNGVMVMKRKDGTLYSCLTGSAFAGPRVGHRLTLLPTVSSTWGFWLKQYPGTVAYHMFDKYQPIDLTTAVSADSKRSRTPADSRLPAAEPVLGVAVGRDSRAYPLKALSTVGLIHDQLGGRPCDVLWFGPTHTAAAYEPVAHAPDGGSSRSVDLVRDSSDPDAPFRDRQTGSRWDIAGRAMRGALKGWTLRWLDGTQVKWYAWAAEYPRTTLYVDKNTQAPPKSPPRFMIAGTAEVLRTLPKRFAHVVEVDGPHRRITLRVEGESLPKVWQLLPDAEIKVAGWWGWLEQFRPGDRAWVWFSLNRHKQPAGVIMLADELSAQDIHGHGVTLQQRHGNQVTVKPAEGPVRTLDAAGATVWHGQHASRLADLRPGQTVYVESRGQQAILVLDRAAFEEKRHAQQAALRTRWRQRGLPGTVMFTHLSGEMEFMVDHEGLRWARLLRPGDRVTLRASPPIAAQVRAVRPWRERTQLRLVVGGTDLAGLHVGQRTFLQMTEPPAAVEAATWPPDLDRPRPREDRIEWFLASLYCPCGVGGDSCTGDFYTLASCNPNSCGMPALLRKQVALLMDQGLNDRQILGKLLQDYGQALLSPHLRP